MESVSTKLGQFLQSFCIDSPWSYAIFWKLHQQDMFLICEDGYYDYSKLQESFQSILDDDYTRQENVSDSISVANLSSVQFATYPIHVAIADMSCHQYELGEGLIGIVASSGRYLWIDVEEVKSSEIMSTLKYPDEWLLAMAAGIKTTLLTPVMPHGVLQLGSLKKMQFSCDATTSLSINETMVTEACATQSLDESVVATSLTSSPSFESLMGAHVKDKNVVECAYGLSNSKCAKETKVNKRKTKAKSGHRQRPRDRQLIQNRLKELRELVPNVEQCSIDGLLEQTIKHMTFLKSVNQHAEKLKQFNDKVIVDKEKNTTRHCCATSSTLKVEQNHGSCPVVVKDLEHPGQILIQMLCNNEGIFFEMAEVIHQLKLTILKGVMETCCSNWAHFVVQASIGFNRLDIFWPLMKILQRNGDWTMNQWNP